MHCIILYLLYFSHFMFLYFLHLLLLSSILPFLYNYTASPLIYSFSLHVALPIYNERFSFYNRVLNGQKEPRARWKRVEHALPTGARVFLAVGHPDIKDEKLIEEKISYNVFLRKKKIKKNVLLEKKNKKKK